jgi:hypothetical protein
MCADMLCAVGTVSCSFAHIVTLVGSKTFIVIEPPEVLVPDMITFLVSITIQYTVGETGEKEYSLN